MRFRLTPQPLFRRPTPDNRTRPPPAGRRLGGQPYVLTFRVGKVPLPSPPKHRCPWAPPGGPVVLCSPTPRLPAAALL